MESGPTDNRIELELPGIRALKPLRPLGAAGPELVRPSGLGDGPGREEDELLGELCRGRAKYSLDRGCAKARQPEAVQSEAVQSEAVQSEAGKPQAKGSDSPGGLAGVLESRAGAESPARGAVDRRPREVADSFEGFDEGSQQRVTIKAAAVECEPRWHQAFSVLRRSACAALPSAVGLRRAKDGRLCLLSAWVEGQSLLNWLEKREQNPRLQHELDERGGFVGLLRALYTLHRLEIWHGDLSPRNIVIDEEGQLSLIDFGLMGQRGCGTPGYLAPESLRGEGGPQADVFAFALIVMRVWGRRGFLPDVAQVQAWTQKSESQRLQAVRAHLGEGYADESSRLAAMLDPDPHRRPEAAEILQHWCETAQPDPQWGAGGEASPSRWLDPGFVPFVGMQVQRLWKTIESSDAPCVLVVGTSGSGTGRCLEELVLESQARSQPVRQLRAGGEGPGVEGGATCGGGYEVVLGSWLECEAGLCIVHGMSFGAFRKQLDADPSAPSWETLLDLADATLVMREPAESEVLAQGGSCDFAVYRLEAWTPREVQQALAHFMTGPAQSRWQEAQEREWIDGLYARFRGAAGATVRELFQIARSGPRDPQEWMAQRPGRALDSRAGLALSPGKGPREGLGEGLGEDLAEERNLRLRLEEQWQRLGSEQPHVIALAPSMRSKAAQWARAWIRARGPEALKLSVLELLRDPELIDAWRGQWLTWGASAQLRLARAWLLDARPVDAGVDDGADSGVGRRGGRQIDGLKGRLAHHLEDESLRHLSARLIAAGQSERLLEIPGDGAGAGFLFQRARARQARGQIRESDQLIEAMLATSDPSAQVSAAALRLRALCDRGQAQTALKDAPSAATLRAARPWARHWWKLWAAYAQAQLEAKSAEERYRDLQAEVKAEAVAQSGLERHTLLARILQLRGNHAWLDGQSETALDLYQKAALEFQRAGEIVGEAMAWGNLEALAIPNGALKEAWEAGERAYRSMVAHRCWQPLGALVCNHLPLLMMLDKGPRALAIARQAQQRFVAGSLDGARVELVLAELGELSLGGEDMPAKLGVFMELAGAAEAWDACLRFAELAWAFGDRPRALALLDLRNNIEAPADEGLWLRAELCRARLGQVTAKSRLLARAAQFFSDRKAPLRDPNHLLCLREWLLYHAIRVEEPPGTWEALRQLWCSSLEALRRAAPAGDGPALSRYFEQGGARDSEEQTRWEETLVYRLGSFSAPAPASASASASASANASLKASRGPDDDFQRAEFRRRSVYRMYRRLARYEELDRLLAEALEFFLELCEGERGMIVVRDERGQKVVAREFGSTAQGLATSRTLVEGVFASGESVLSVDAARDGRFEHAQSVTHLNLRSVMAVPLIAADGVLGVVYVDSRLRRAAFDREDLLLLEEFAALVVLAVVHAQRCAQMQAQVQGAEAALATLKQALASQQLEATRLRETMREWDGASVIQRGLVGHSEGMREVFRLVERFALAKAPVVILGEAGTGKSAVARAIHEAEPSPLRADREPWAGRPAPTSMHEVGRAGPNAPAERPWVIESCAAIPESLLDEVLWGRAEDSALLRPGLASLAEGGTLYLKDIDALPAASQNKLLRILESKEWTPQGGSAAMTLEARVIVSSTRDLETLARQGHFLPALWYRLCVLSIRVPPLRERVEDLPLLITHWLGQSGGDALEFRAQAMRTMQRYAWPGNLRELYSELRRLVVMGCSTVQRSDLAEAIQEGLVAEADPDDLRIRPRVDRLERHLVQKALQRSGGNQSHAASLLGLSRFGLQKKLRRWAEEDDDEGNV